VKTLTIRPINLHPLGTELRTRVEALVEQGNVGELYAHPEILAVLFHLAGVCLDGKAREDALALADWYDAEAKCA
jgi:hypothetical protein